MISQIEKIYNNSPSYLQNLLISLYGLKVYRREYGKKFRKTLDEFEKMQWYSINELKEYQNIKLRTLIKHCYENVPYYKKVMSENKLAPTDIRSIDDLYKMPILTSEDVKKNTTTLTASNFKLSQLTIGHTSGTTGSPLKFIWDREICLVKNVVDWRQKRWGGINPQDKMGIFWGRVVMPVTRIKPPFWRLNSVLNQLLFSSYHLSVDNMELYIKQLNKFAPKALEGYPSTLYIVARFLLNRKTTFPLKAVFTSSEFLFPLQREAIEKAFECNVFDFYGMAERVVFATECQMHQGLHLNMDFGITEILNKDNKPASPGEMGRIVATSLHNCAMPLIRYQTSDVTALKKEKCTCGREFPLMQDVTTRAEDIITTRDGRYISFASLTLPLKTIHNIVESQIIQEDNEHIIIKIVQQQTFTKNDTQILLDKFKKILGSGMRLEIEFVDSIPRTKAGKFRYVISKVPLEF